MQRRLVAPIVVAAALTALGTAAVIVGLRDNHQPDADPRLTTYGTGPAGARGFAETLQRTGVRITRLRSAPTTGADSTSTTPLALLDPSQRITSGEGIALANASVDRNLLLAGDGALAVMRCYGYGLDWPTRRRVRLDGPPADSMNVSKVLVADTSRTVTDRAAATDRLETSCTVAVPQRIDTLMMTIDSELVMLRLTNGSQRVMLISDGAILSNRRLRRTTIGVAVAGPIRETFDALAIDEYHHGYEFAKENSPARAVLGWSLTSPWGWATWQLVVFGFIALIAGGVRFGPLIPLERPNRRSPLEHVHALATAFGATRGHGEGVRWIVRGLRRRLGRYTPGVDEGVWLSRTRDSVRSARGRAALDTLQNALREPTADAPRAAAVAADTLWEEWHS